MEKSKFAIYVYDVVKDKENEEYRRIIADPKAVGEVLSTLRISRPASESPNSRTNAAR